MRTNANRRGDNMILSRPASAAGLPLLLLTGILIAGCGRSQAQNGAPKADAPEVDVSNPATGMVTDYEYFPGRLMATRSVEVRARVTGYLDELLFQEGTDVAEGTVLFQIDPRPYEAERDRAEGSLMQSRGRLQRMEEEYERAKGFHAKGFVSQEESAV